MQQLLYELLVYNGHTVPAGRTGQEASEVRSAERGDYQ